MSLFQNSVSFGKGFRKTVLKDDFSFKYKVAFPTLRTQPAQRKVSVTYATGGVIFSFAFLYIPSINANTFFYKIRKLIFNTYGAFYINDPSVIRLSKNVDYTTRGVLSSARKDGSSVILSLVESN